MKQAVAEHPILILVRGMPGSGKSYLADELRQAIGVDKAMVLDPDAVDFASPEYIELSKTLMTEGLDERIHPYRFLRSKAYDGILAGKAIIWNQPFTEQGMFGRLAANLEAYAADHSIHMQTVVVEVDVDPAIAKERVLTRKREGAHGPSDVTLAKRIDDYKSLADAGYRIVSVRGDGDVAVSVAAVLDVLRGLRSA